MNFDELRKETTGTYGGATVKVEVRARPEDPDTTPVAFYRAMALALRAMADELEDEHREEDDYA